MPIMDMKENYCRLCKNFFCCSTCRLKHEISQHAIHPDCEICVHGYTSLRQPSESLLEHINENHLPLNCLFCKDTYSTVEELNRRGSCHFTASVVTSEGKLLVANQKCDTPPILNTLIHKNIFVANNMTTSTPMQNCNERELQDNIPETITPVEFISENNKTDKPLTSIMKIGVTPCGSEHESNPERIKRRVTFSDTPVNEHTSNFKEKSSVYVDATQGSCGIKNSLRNRIMYVRQSSNIRRFKILANGDALVEHEQSNIEKSMKTSHLESYTTPSLRYGYRNNEHQNYNSNSTFFHTASCANSCNDNFYASDNKENDVKNPIWSSVKNLLKNIVQGYNGSTKKRSKPDSSFEITDSPERKKIKLYDIQCRRNIHDLDENIRFRKKVDTCDKATQTD